MSTNADLGRKNVLWALALVALFLILFGGTILVGWIYLLLD